MYESNSAIDYMLLKLAYGLFFLTMGVHTLLFAASDLSTLIHPGMLAAIPIDTVYVMYGIGCLQVLISLLIFSKYTYVGALLACVNLLLNALNLYALAGRYQIILGDFVLAVGAIVLARIARRHEKTEI